MMSIPGLALFYGGLVRAKNMLSVLMQVLMIVCVASLIWVACGYCMAFTGGSPYVGGFSKAFLMGVNAASLGGDLLQRRLHSRICLSLLPDDLRLHHAGADRRRRSRSG